MFLVIIGEVAGGRIARVVYNSGLDSNWHVCIDLSIILTTGSVRWENIISM